MLKDGTVREGFQMTHRWLASTGGVALVTAAAFLVSAPAFAQAVSPASKPASAVKTEKAAKIPRTPDGHPDLQGFWENVTLTPLDRPKDLAGKEFFTPQEAVEYEKSLLPQRNHDNRK